MECDPLTFQFVVRDDSKRSPYERSSALQLRRNWTRMSIHVAVLIHGMLQILPLTDHDEDIVQKPGVPEMPFDVV